MAETRMRRQRAKPKKRGGAAKAGSGKTVQATGTETVEAGEAPASRNAGPRRSSESAAAIREAARAELAKAGWRGFSAEGVAKAAGSSKQTLYKWWPSIGALCVDAVTALIPPPPQGAEDDIQRLAAVIAPFEGVMRTGDGHAVMRYALAAAADDADAGAQWRDYLASGVRLQLRAVLAELANKKVLGRDKDVDEAFEFLLGPLFSRVMFQRSPVPQGYSLKRAGEYLTLNRP